MACRLLYLIGQLRDGGSERQLYYLLKTIDREKYYPHVAVWNYREDDKYVSKIRALRVPLYAFGGISIASKLVKMRELRGLVRRLAPEVLHSYSFHTNFAAWYAALGTGTLPVGSVRSEFSRSKANYGFLLGRLCARWPRQQIFNSICAADSAQRMATLFAPHHGFVVRNGVDLAQFRSTPLPNGERPTIIGIGSLTQVKRWDRLLRAAFQLKQRGCSFLVRIVGDGILRASLEAQVKELGIDNCVEFIGRTAEVPDRLSEATMLAHTAESEGCPNVVMEAMACARPVVAMDAGDIPSLVDEGKTGFVVPRGDDDSFAARLASLALNRKLCREMGLAARAKVEREFTLSHLVENTLAAYDAAIGSIGSLPCE